MIIRPKLKFLNKFFKKSTVKDPNFGPHGIFEALLASSVPPDHLLLDSAPNIGPLISFWKLDKFINC